MIQEEKRLPQAKRASKRDRWTARSTPPRVSSATPAASAFLSMPALVVALVALVAWVFFPVIHFDFVSWDDPFYVTTTPMVLAGLTWRGVAWAFTTGYAFYWHPLTWLSHMLDVQMFGLAAGGHHATSVFWHLINTLLVFGVFFRLTGARAQSAVVAALFAVHPLHVESVAWIAERKDVLSTCFLLLAIWAYAGYTRAPSLRRYAIVALCFALGLMAKPMVVTLPVLLLLLDVWPAQRLTLQNWRPRVVEKLPLVALGVAAGVAAIAVQQHVGAAAGLSTLPLGTRVENALLSTTTYVAQMFWPVHLAAFYPYPRAISTVRAACAAAALVVATVAAALVAKRQPYVIVGWLWFLVGLAPVAGFIQVGDQARADRFTYVPLIGLFVIVAWGVPVLAGRMKYRRIALPLAAVIVVAACACAARVQVGFWRNSETMWTRALAVTSDNFRAQAGLADVLVERGDASAALPHYAEAVRLAPGAAQWHNSFGLALTAAGRLDEAVAQYREALHVDGSSAEVHNNLGAVLARQQRLDEACAEYLAALRMKPDYALAHRNLGIALAMQGHLDHAIEEWRTALRLDPSQARWHYEVGAVIAATGNTSAAAREFETALKLDPADPDARQALARIIKRE